MFSVYYTTEFTFTEPKYFNEITEDFRPFLENGIKLQRDSPKRYVSNAGNRDYRYKGMDYANFTSDRIRPSKKGAYNFIRTSVSNHQQIFRANDTEITRATDDWHAEKRLESNIELKTTIVNDSNLWKLDNIRDKLHLDKSPRLDTRKMEIAPILNDLKISDNKTSQSVGDDRKPLEEKKPVYDKKLQKIDDKKSQKPIEKKEKQSADNSGGTGKIGKDNDKDIDGFTKVRNRKRQKSESQNENVNWVIHSTKESK